MRERVNAFFNELRTFISRYTGEFRKIENNFVTKKDLALLEAYGREEETKFGKITLTYEVEYKGKTTTNTIELVGPQHVSMVQHAQYREYGAECDATLLELLVVKES